MLRFEIVWLATLVVTPKSDCGSSKAAKVPIEQPTSGPKAIAVAPVDATTPDAAEVFNIPEVEVTLAKLAADYLENEIGADERYTGVVLRIPNVTIHRIGRDDEGVAVLELEVATTHSLVKAHFDEESEAGLVKVRPGQRVSLRCACGGFMPKKGTERHLRLDCSRVE